MEDLKKRLSDLEAERDYYRLVAKRLGQKALADAQDFSQMIRDLRQREVKLQQSQEALEKNIEERTAELKESEERLNFLVKNSSDSLVILNRDGSQRFVSPAAERITGYPIAELEGRTIDTLIHPDDLAEVMAAWNEAVAHPEKTVTVQYRHIHKTDGWVFSEAIAQSFLNVPAIDGVIASVRDITERKQVEDSLKEQRWRLASIIEGTNIGTWEWNVQTGDVRINERWAQMLGYTIDELTPVNIKIWRMFCHPDDLKRSSELLEQHFAGKQPYYHDESRMKHKDGHWIWILDRGSVVTRTEDGKPLMMFGTHSDITERKLMEQQKEKFDVLNRQIQKADSLHRMAGAIAHHFNNQLGVVIGNLELALDDLRQKVVPDKSVMAAMQGARKAAEVSGLMLTYLGQTTGKSSPLNLSETIRKTLPLLQATAPKDLILTVDLPDPGPTIDANDNHIQQVLTNLATNGWEACANHGSVWLTVKTVQPTAIPATHRLPIDWQPIDPAYACVEVTDTGSGISNEDIDRLFDPFFSSKFAGRGLGLPVVLGIVKAYGGAVSVESAVGRGSTFRVFLPVSADKISPPTVKAAEPVQGEMSGTVLLVEDEEMMREVTRNMLIRLGFHCLAAKDGSEAVSLFTQHPDDVDVVLCDLSMPGMNGWETLSALRKIRPGLPVILASGHDESKVFAGDHRDPVQGFLHKPYLKALLKDVVARAMKTG
jgi:PAS domain S-box-containing protein